MHTNIDIDGQNKFHTFYLFLLYRCYTNEAWFKCVFASIFLIHLSTLDDLISIQGLPDGWRVTEGGVNRNRFRWGMSAVKSSVTIVKCQWSRFLCDYFLNGLGGNHQQIHWAVFYDATLLVASIHFKLGILSHSIAIKMNNLTIRTNHLVMNQMFLCEILLYTVYT